MVSADRMIWELRFDLQHIYATPEYGFASYLSWLEDAGPKHLKRLPHPGLGTRYKYYYQVV